MKIWESAQAEEVGCGDDFADRYLETPLTRVYGDVSVSEERLQVIANAVHHYYPKVLTEMGMETDSLEGRHLSQVARGYISSVGDTSEWDYTQTALKEKTDFAGTVNNETEVMTQFLKLSPSDLETVARRAFQDSSVTYDSSMFYLTINDDKYNYRYENPRITVCVDSQMDSNRGTGKNWGIIVGENPRPDIVHHELVHYVQKRLTGGNVNISVPRWFTEGQAVSISGQNLAGEDDIGTLNPIKIETFGDENGKDMGTAYSLYGLAYEYINEKTSAPAMNELLRNSFMTIDQTERSSFQVQFKDAFPSYVNDPQGESLDYYQFKSTWESRALNYVQ